MTDDWPATRATYAEAARWFAAQTAHVGDRWDAPGLGTWDVRALVGHTSRALLTVETYLGVPAGAVDVPTAAAYYAVTRDLAAGPAVEQRGRDAGAALGDDPARAVADVVARVLPRVDATDGTELVTTVAGGMRLADYLPTRTFELVVHTLDLAAALDLPAAPPPSAARAAARVLADVAVDAGRAGDLLLAATGRRPLPTGFTVL